MNRIEFMETLSRLLLDIPEEDRIDALKYYNDYFDDAGSENEQNVIEELESPEKVAMKIKADREDTGTTEEYDTDTGKGQAERTSRFRIQGSDGYGKYISVLSGGQIRR